MHDKQGKKLSINANNVDSTRCFVQYYFFAFFYCGLLCFVNAGLPQVVERCFWSVIGNINICIVYIVYGQIQIIIDFAYMENMDMFYQWVLLFSLKFFRLFRKALNIPKRSNSNRQFAKTTIFLQFSSSDHNSYMEILCDLCKIAWKCLPFLIFVLLFVCFAVESWFCFPFKLK